MLDQLEKTRLDALQYRRAVDGIFSPALNTSEEWRTCLKQIQLCTVQLYLDYLLVAVGEHELERLVLPSTKRKSFPSDTHREQKLREKLRLRLSAADSWPGFNPQNPFSDLTGFGTLRDYTESFALHLPEIYEETFRVEACIGQLLITPDEGTLVTLSFGLKHLGQNHAGFVIQPLEWASDECSWEG